MPILTLLLFAIPSDPAALCAMTGMPEDISPAELDRAYLQTVAASLPDCMPAHHLLGYSYMDEKNRDMSIAIEHLERARELAPNHSQMLTLLGQVYFMRASQDSSLSDASDGVEALEQAVAANPDNLDARSLLASFHRNAPWIAGGDIDEAYAQAAEIRQRDLKRGLLEQARTLRADGEEDAAIELARSTLKSFPDFAPLALEYALLMQEKENFPEAHRVLLAVTRDADADLDALYQLGRTAALSGEFREDGRAALKRYLARGEAGEELPIEAASAWWRLGMIEQHDGKLDAARAAYEQALRLDPEAREAARALDSLSTPGA